MSARPGLIAGPLVPALLCLVLGVAVFAEFGRPQDVPSAAAIPVSNDAPLTGAAVQILFDLPPVAAFSEIADRPVFSPSRRPAYVGLEPGEEPDNALQSRDELDVTVVGIITGPRALALLRPEGGSGLVPLAEGERLSGWTLTAIEPFRLVFQRDGDERTIELEFREN